MLVTLYSICLSLSDLYLVQCPPNPAAAAKSLQLCPTLCNPIDGSPPGSSAPGILQARTLEWVAISFSNAWKRKAKVKSLSGVQLFTTTWTAAYQAPPSMGFSRLECWSGLPLPSPPNPPIVLQMARLHFLWLSSIPFHVCMYVCVCVCIHTYTTSSLSIHLLMNT